METFKKKFPTIVGLLVLVVGVALGVFLIQQQQIFRLGASAELTPKNVQITNVADNMFTVSWTTDTETVGFLNWGESNSLGKTANADIPTESHAHSVTVSELLPNTQYFFSINSNAQEFKDGGSPWTVTTTSDLGVSPNTSVLSGTVLDEAGSPAGGALVYARSAGMNTLSVQASPGGRWVIPLSYAVNASGTAHATIVDNTLFDIEVVTGTSVSTAQVFAGAGDPTPDIITGQNYDFRDNDPISEDGLPDTDVNLPEDFERDSGFDTEGFEVDNVITEGVTIESVEEGETIFTESPEFFGDAPVNTVLTVTVESDPQTETVAVGTDGQWEWTPPEDLEPGEHTITIEWDDPVSGILQTIERSFTVLAAEDEPAFESTPSATASPSATATPEATISGLPDDELPDAGIALPTIAGLSAGIFLIIGALLLAL